MKIAFNLKVEEKDKLRVAKLATRYDHETAKMGRICLLRGLEVLEEDAKN